jgi:hypothetical protein
VILCDYTCPACETFETLVESPAPDVIACPACSAPSTWTPPSTLHGSVKRWEVVRGGWTKPERSTYYDTRELGEGMPIDEWRAKRQAKWDESRKSDVAALARGE